MIEGIGQYILRLCCCAIIAGSILAIGGNSKVQKWVVGLFMASAVISAMGTVSFSELQTLVPDHQRDANQITSAAQISAKEATERIIIERTRSYILDEASSLDASIEVVAIRLDSETLAPTQITLTGDLSAYAHSKLSNTISTHLGVGKEDQIWNP